MENYLMKVKNTEDQANIVFKISYYFLQLKVFNEWKDIHIWEPKSSKVQSISEWFPKKLPEEIHIEDDYWKRVNQIFYTYYHFSIIKEYCMRFYSDISIDILKEWFVILISISSIQELHKKDIEKMTDIYFKTHMDMKAMIPIKINFSLFSEYLNYHSFLDNYFIINKTIRPRNLSMELELEDNELIDIYDRIDSPSLIHSFQNFEIYSKYYQGGFTPHHFWMSSTGEDRRSSSFNLYNCSTPIAFAS